MKLGQSNRSPFNHPIKKLKSNTNYLVKIIRTKIGNSEGDTKRGGEVVQFIKTIATMTIGTSKIIFWILYDCKQNFLSIRHFKKVE